MQFAALLIRDPAYSEPLRVHGCTRTTITHVIEVELTANRTAVSVHGRAMDGSFCAEGKLDKSFRDTRKCRHFQRLLPLKMKKTGNRTTVFVHGQPMDGLFRV